MQQRDLPVFIKIDDYKDITDIMQLIKEKVKEANVLMDKIDELRREESSELSTWRSELSEIGRNVDLIDKTLFHNQ